MSLEKSKKRSKKSAGTVADFLAKEGAAALVPGGSLIYDIGKRLFAHGKEYYSDRTEIRLEEFHREILTGNVNEKNIDDFLSKPFDADDYAAVVSSCVQDIENEKVKLYSKLMHSLISKKFEPEVRRHFITSCKEINLGDASFLRELFINSKHDLMTAGGQKQQVANLLKHGHNTINKIKIEKLNSLGFIDKEKSKLTTLGEDFINSIFLDTQLTPKSLGRKEFTGHSILIISYNLSEQSHVNVSRGIQEALWKNQIKSSIQILDSRRPDNSFLYSGVFLLIDENPIAEEYIKSVQEFSQKNKPILRVNLTKDAELMKYKELEFIDSITLESTSSIGVQNQIESYLNQPLA